MAYQTQTPKIVLITGATGGIGEATARRFAEAGSHLILAGRNEDKLAKLQKSIQSEFNVNAHTMCFDITDQSAMEQAISDIPNEFQAIDLLVNNAGGAHGMSPFQEASMDDLKTMIDTNVIALTFMSRLIIEGMIERGTGTIINIGSIAGNHPYPGGHVYCGAKAYVKQLTEALRADLTDKNVRIINIEPGMVETQFSEVRFKGNKEKADAVYAGANALQPEDIAETAFLAASLPQRVNITTMEVMPTTQAPGPLQVYRNKDL